MTLEQNLLNLGDDILNANNVKDLILSRLLIDKKISKEIALEYSEKWQIIIIKKSWFKKWVEKFKIPEPNNYTYMFVKFED